MISYQKKRTKKLWAFTLIEMMIVLIIMWIITMLCISLSGDMVNKVKNKTIKENILAERQSHYSRNISTSTYKNKIYNNLEINIATWNSIKFTYSWNEINSEDIFTDKFQITNIIINWNQNNTTRELNLRLSPYKINCNIVDNQPIEEVQPNDENQNNTISILTKINDMENYCFEIFEENCRLREVSCDKYQQYFITQ